MEIETNEGQNPGDGVSAHCSWCQVSQGSQDATGQFLDVCKLYFRQLFPQKEETFSLSVAQDRLAMCRKKEGRKE